MPPASRHKEDLTSPANALQGLYWALLALLIKVEEPFYQRYWTGHICPIITGMHTCKYRNMNKVYAGPKVVAANACINLQPTCNCIRSWRSSAHAHAEG